MASGAGRVRSSLSLLLGLWALSCSAKPEAPAPLVVVGVDGGDRKVIETLWARGELPASRRLAEAGSFHALRTAYGKSPVIWTSIATGMRPEQHGITDFVVATPAGDLPISSAARKRPALWDLLGRVNRRSAVLGWWATWPAEEVRGALLLSDRAGLGLENEIAPVERTADLERWTAASKKSGLDFGDNDVAEMHDRIVTIAATELLREPFDLILAYYRSVDVVSHWQWHTFQPEKFPGGPPAGAASSPLAEPLLDAYRTFDAALGEIVSAAPTGSSFLVLSDHGFHAERSSEVAIHLEFDRVLEALGYLVRAGEAIDVHRSLARTHSSPAFRQTKLVRLREDLTPAARQTTLERLSTALTRVRFPDGSSAFSPRKPTAKEREQGAELAVPITARALWGKVELDGREIVGAVLPVDRLTGTHDEHTRGILIASGPLFAAGSELNRVHIHDIAPTILYALGLPVGDDFAGVAQLALFRPEFTTGNPVRRIASWGTRATSMAPASARDRELLDDLAALGYLK